MYFIIKFKATLDLLIEKKCDVNAQDELGYSALHHAVLKNNYGAVALLLEISKLKINVRNHEKYFLAKLFYFNCVF